jgi:hypothetical protein
MRKETSYLKKFAICYLKRERAKSANSNFNASFELDARLTVYLRPRRKKVDGAFGQ